MSNNFPRKRLKPSESILNVSNLPSASGQSDDLLLRLLVWLLWKDTTCFGSVLRLHVVFCSGTQVCPCLSHCRINIASSKSQNPSVSLLFIYKIKFQLQKMVHFSPPPVFFQLRDVMFTQSERFLSWCWQCLYFLPARKAESSRMFWLTRAHRIGNGNNYNDSCVLSEPPFLSIKSSASSMPAGGV